MEDAWFPLQFYFKKFNAELLFTDTESLTFEIKSKTVYEEFFRWKDLTLIIIQKVQSFLMRLAKILLVKWVIFTKIVSWVVIIKKDCDYYCDYLLLLMIIIDDYLLLLMLVIG